VSGFESVFPAIVSAATTAASGVGSAIGTVGAGASALGSAASSVPVVGEALGAIPNLVGSGLGGVAGAMGADMGPLLAMMGVEGVGVPAASGVPAVTGATGVLGTTEAASTALPSGTAGMLPGEIGAATPEAMSAVANSYGSTPGLAGKLDADEVMRVMRMYDVLGQDEQQQGGAPAPGGRPAGGAAFGKPGQLQNLQSFLQKAGQRRGLAGAIQPVSRM
jgi:hypothetical protein